MHVCLYLCSYYITNNKSSKGGEQGRVCNRPPHILVRVILSSQCTLMLRSRVYLVYRVRQVGKGFAIKPPRFVRSSHWPMLTLRDRLYHLLSPTSIFYILVRCSVALEVTFSFFICLPLVCFG